MSEATAVARAASEVESLFCKGRGAEKFNVESSLQIELSFEGSHMLPFGLRVGAKSSSAAALFLRASKWAGIPNQIFDSSLVTCS